MKKNIVIVAVIAFIVGGGIGFWSGSLNTNASRPTRGSFSGTRSGQGGFVGGNGKNAGFVNGTILGIDPNGITVSTQGGGSKIVLVSGSTQITKPVAGLQSDLATGTSVTVIGVQNPDGSVSAQSIQMRNNLPGRTQ